ncbi:MAG: hypothetical protein BGO70_12310 [Bacteroidetes bacterium 43-93]|nr:tetratricopeptide repeat protein [Bacteroidota bacterium]OJW98239.1 MAG: hypothetical protein BGO70_12310 [Bacteroidetes bacterium 43-93]
MNKGKNPGLKTAHPQTFPKPRIWAWIASIVFITLIVYTPVFSDLKEFTNWDDYAYVTDQPLIKNLDGETVGNLFKPSTTVMLNYHPLTMISLAWDYQQGFDDTDNTLSITPFVRTNVLLHLLNTALVFLFLYRLSRKKIWAAALPALLFGIHPMHVESVAWISERKDVLYCFFFLVSCISYLQYIDSKKTWWLGLSFILFIASCLSKAMAVPLPLVLLLIDYLENRKIGIKVLIEKLPFLIVSIILGIIALQPQSHAMGGADETPVFYRFLYGCYGFVMYWLKLIAPINLSAFYPYPGLTESGGLPAIYYLMPVIALAIIVTPFILIRRQKNERNKVILSGMLFFLAMTVLVLQFVSVGPAIMADRYSYVSYIGPLFIAGIFLQDLVENPKTRSVMLGIVSAYCLLLAITTYNRIPVWQNSKTLWTDVIQKYPYDVEQVGNNTVIKKIGAKTAYKNLADWYAEHQLLDSAYRYYQVLILAGTKDAEVWSNAGNIYAMKGQLTEALNALNKAISLDPKNTDNYIKRGLVHMQLGKTDEAIADMDQALAADPSNAQAKDLRKKFMEHRPK